MFGVRVEVAGRKTNSVDEVVARLVDYGPVFLALIALMGAVWFLPYPTVLQIVFSAAVGAFIVVYQLIVAKDTRPTVYTESISGGWFLLAFVVGLLGWASGHRFESAFGVPLGDGAVVSMIPVQIAVGLMLFLSVQGMRQRHSLLISTIGIAGTTFAVIAATILTLRPPVF